MKCAAFAALIAIGCGSKPGRAPVPGAGSLLSSVALAPSFATPATWRYHPSRQAPVEAERALSDGRLLLAGKRGERWVLDPHTHSLSAGASLAPEDLIAVLDAGDRYWFVGQSGTSYEARDPLGKFLRSSAPLEPLVRVSAALQSIVGIPADRSLLRSLDGAASFSKVGPPHVAFADVELGSDGVGLALAVPEALWLTRDAGATWSALPGKTHGVVELSRNLNGHIQVDTVFGPYRFVEEPPSLQPGAEVVPNPITDRPPRGPDANALADGRAIIEGPLYLEISAAPAHPSDYELFQGALDGKLEPKAIPELKGCRNARLTGFANYLELACFRGSIDGTSVPVSFFRSDTKGEHFELEPFNAFGNPELFHFALGAGGSLVASGLCAEPSMGCAPGGVFLRREAPPNERPEKDAAADASAKRPKLELFASATPSLADNALGVTVSLDGRTAYAVGRRTKTGALAVFTSHDGGKSFDVHDLDLVRADADDEDQYWERSQSALHLESFAAAEDGSLGLVVADRRGRALIVVDEQGRMLSASKAPDERALVAAVGARAFALTPSTRKTWESMDGGVTWQALGRFPVALCTGDSECYVKVRCAPLGCVIGSEVSRIGWVGQSDEDVDSLPPPGLDASPPSERKLRAPVACTLEDTPWQTLPGVRELPTSHHAAFGKAAFVVTAEDAAHASVASMHGIGGPRPHVETTSLLAPVSERVSTYAFVLLDQVEGAAALRYRVPDDPAKDDHIRNVEIAWDNALAGQLARVRLADGGLAAPGDYESGDGVVHADPDLLSIGEGGLYLRLHHAAADRQETWYFDGHSSSRIPKVQWPALGKVRARSEMARIDGANLPLLVFDRGIAIARARLDGQDFVFDAETTALPEPSFFGQNVTSDIAYLSKNSGLHVQTQSLLGARASAVFYPFRASGDVMGAPVPVPTQANLADRPSRCAASDLTSTPRINAPFLPGTRHPIVVTDNSDAPRLFLSSGFVLYGTPENACSTAFDGDEIPVDAAAPRHERVLILLDDLEHSWLFRLVGDSNATPPALQYRTLKCHFEPDLDVPSDVYRAPGTLVPRGG
ncbi:MAG TPA: hypothetical protein VK745_24640 [Polyangiaceae bacterium]|nr:hypothetical protein [Polyangiaceae bacterium]